MDDKSMSAQDAVPNQAALEAQQSIAGKIMLREAMHYLMRKLKLELKLIPFQIRQQPIFLAIETPMIPPKQKCLRQREITQLT
jgi:hypothetical protein